jgi:hypothetical protein
MLVPRLHAIHGHLPMYAKDGQACPFPTPCADPCGIAARNQLDPQAGALNKANPPALLRAAAMLPSL